MNFPRTRSRDLTPPQGVDVHDVRSLHRAMRRRALASLVALVMSTVAVVLSLLALLKGTP